MSPKKKLSLKDQERVDIIIAQLLKESKDIQEAIAVDFPAYKTFKSLGAKTFREFALLPIAREEGLNYEDVLFNYNKVKPNCPICNKKDTVRTVGEEYICKACNKKFTANYNSISSNSKSDAATWLKVLNCILDNKTIKETCNLCSINQNNYYLIRTKLFYAMQIMMEEIKLYGKIQVDNTFTRVSYKGMSLQENEYPEDSPFYDPTFIPRSARSRGGSYNFEDLDKNKVCIFTAIDDFGHVMVRFVCIGSASFGALKSAVEKEKFLTVIPESDCFEFTYRKMDHSSRKGEESLFITDGELALISFGEYTGLNIEYHKYRNKGKQIKLPEGANNIQRVNQLHHKLKEFLRKSNFVSTKYLSGFLILFEFIQNTGATEEAIQYLFEIIAKPGLGRPAAFYKNIFVTPNYILHSNTPEKPLSKIPHNYLEACYLYHLKKENKLIISMDEIFLKTNCTAKVVRRAYKNLIALGVLDDVIERFSISKDNNEVISVALPKKRFGIYSSPELLAIRDEYEINRNRPDHERMTREEFVKYANKKYGQSLTVFSMNNRFSSMAKWGLRPKLGRLPRNNNYVSTTHNRKEEMLVYVKEAEALMAAQKRNNTYKSKLNICTTIEEKYGLHPMSLYKHIDYMGYWK